MNPLKITSLEGLDATVAEVCLLKLKIGANQAELEAQKAALDKKFAPIIGDRMDRLVEAERAVADYCEAHRAELFADKKSRETNAAVIGYEFTPFRVETSSRKIKWRDVIDRLLKLSWGKAYLRTGEVKIDKEALLADRENLTAVRRLAAGIQFAQDEQFFIRPKSEVAEQTVIKEAA